MPRKSLKLVVITTLSTALLSLGAFGLTETEKKKLDDQAVKAQETLRQHPHDKDALLDLADTYSQEKRLPELKKVTDELMRYHPKDKDARFYHAVTLSMQKRHGESYQELLQLQRDEYSGKYYPHQIQLAEEAMHSGYWHESIALYRAAVANPNLPSDDLRDAQEELDSLSLAHANALLLSEGGEIYNNGAIWRTEGIYSWDLDDPLRFSVRYHMDNIYLHGNDTLKSGWHDREEALFGLRHQIPDEWLFSTWLGGSVGPFTDNVVAGGRVQRQIDEDRTIALEGALNERSTESILQEYLNGRQNRVSLITAWQFWNGLDLSFQIDARQYRLDDQELGWGGYGVYSLDQTVWKANPGIVLSLQGSYSAFHRTGDQTDVLSSVLKPEPGGTAASDQMRRESILDGLVSERQNRHGVGFTLTQPLAKSFTCHVTFSALYAFEEDGWVYDALGGADYRPCQNWKIMLEGGYTTSAAGGNSGSPETVVNFSVRAFF